MNIKNIKNYLIKTITLLVAFFCVLSIPSFAHRTYYISFSLGDDSYDGLSKIYDGIHGPWKTLSKIKGIKFNPGDSILLKRSDTWNEQLVINSSGTSNSNITLGAYGIGNKPILDGTDTITSWKLYNKRNNTWVTTVPQNITNITQIFVDGDRYTLARWPNSRWNTIDSTSITGTYLYDTSLTQPEDYWVDATLVIRDCWWSIDTKTITASSGGGNTIFWDTDLPYGVKATKDYGYYIENKFEQLDTAGEYYFDMKKQMLFIALPPSESPLSHTVEISVLDYNIYAGEIKNVSICDIDIKNAGKYGTNLIRCEYVKILNCVIENSKSGGIYCSNGKHLSFENNTIKYVDEGNGINMNSCPNSTISNNIVHDIASDFTSPRKGRGICLYGISGSSNISGNVIYNIGNHGILVSKGPVTIFGNKISKCVLQTQDNGAIYMNNDQTGSVIEYNQIDNCPGSYQGTPVSSGKGSTVGLYFDETGSHGAIFRYNIVSGCSKGIHLHKSYNTKVVNNTFYNNRYSAISLQEGAQNQMYGDTIMNNLCYADESSDQYLLSIERYSSSTNDIGIFDNNLYFNEDTTYIIRYYKAGTTYYTLTGWQSRTGIDGGNDANSIQSDPLFQDASNDNFHLTSSSPCIDSGADVGLSEDFDGVSVPQGDDPDIGAYEYYEPYNK